MLDKEFIAERLAKSFVELLSKRKGLPRGFSKGYCPLGMLVIYIGKEQKVGAGNMVSPNTVK
jgi:hypothetical protein